MKKVTSRALPIALIAGIVLVGWWNLKGFRAPSDEAPLPSVTIGLISNNPNGLRNIEGFRAELARLGYEEGLNTTYIYSAEPTPKDDLEMSIRNMVMTGADLIFTAGTPTGVAAHRATQGSSVPVVFGVIANPLTAGVMTNLSVPGSNMTGVMLSQNQARRFELFADTLADPGRILVPYNPDDSAPVSAVAQLERIVSDLGVTLVHAHARTNEDVTRILATLSPDLDAIFMLPDSTVNRRMGDLVTAANARGLPISGPSFAQVEAGAFSSYGIIHAEVGAQAARMAQRILQGSDPATTPVQTADVYHVLNVAAADRIKLPLSEAILQTADKILRTDNLSR